MAVVNANIRKAKGKRSVRQPWSAISGRRWYSRPLVSQQGHELDHPVLQVRLPAGGKEEPRGKEVNGREHVNDSDGRAGCFL